jgi:hypothetical protein
MKLIWVLNILKNKKKWITTINEIRLITMTKNNNIYSKLWAIQNEVKRIVRSEENKFQNYHFFNELQVLRLLKPLLEKHRVAIFLTDDSQEPFFCEQKGNNYLVRYLKRLDIVDVETSENSEQKTGLTENGKLTYSFWAVGANPDPAKAKGAAETYAVKYMLTKFFLIPVKNTNDPDYEFNSSIFKENKEELELTEKDKNKLNAKEFLRQNNWYD